ncbi:MAG TPA: alpha-L-fucosidase [Candidatus Binatia bacterium]|nr:alpha-L-fucosidase [Candidatus Binatia bacterium]
MASWFERARFGMFIHWGHVSQRGLEISWPLVGGTPNLPHCQDVPVERYHETARGFSPAPGSPRRWLERARRAGMQYAVFTTKHHDGYAMYDARCSDFSVARSAYGGDLVREYVDAARDLGLKVGFYFSLCDWHHPDYPAFRDEHRPYRFGRQSKPSPEQWARFQDFLFAQLRELLTGYGPIDLLWFDGGWERSAAEWRSRELEDMIRALQPGILINDRLPGVGDFDTPEQFVPPQPPLRAWETCLTMNESWAWNPGDRDYKSARALVHALCEVAGRGGNLLLNVSPTGDGSLPAEQIERLDVIARWMDAYGASIVDTAAGLEPWQFYGPSTRRGNRVYVHLLMRPYEDVTVRGLPIKRVAGVRELRTGEALAFTTRCSILDQLFNSDPMGEVTIQVPERLLDPLATVLELDLADGGS